MYWRRVKLWLCNPVLVSSLDISSYTYPYSKTEVFSKLGLSIAETEAIVATAEFQILCLLEERQRRQNLVKGIRGHADTSQKFKNRAETASTAEANAQDNILLARKLFAIVYAHTEAVEVPRTDREFELAFGRFVRTYGGKTPESLEKRHAEKGRLKSILAATLIGREEDHSVDTPLHCLLYTSPSPRDRTRSRMPSSA